MNKSLRKSNTSIDMSNMTISRMQKLGLSYEETRGMPNQVELEKFKISPLDKPNDKTKQPFFDEKKIQQIETFGEHNNNLFEPPLDHQQIFESTKSDDIQSIISERERNLNYRVKNLTREKNQLYKEIDYLARKVELLQKQLDMRVHQDDEVKQDLKTQVRYLQDQIQNKNFEVEKINIQQTNEIQKENRDSFDYKCDEINKKLEQLEKQIEGRSIKREQKLEPQDQIPLIQKPIEQKIIEVEYPQQIYERVPYQYQPYYQTYEYPQYEPSTYYSKYQPPYISQDNRRNYQQTIHQPYVKPYTQFKSERILSKSPPKYKYSYQRNQNENVYQRDTVQPVYQRSQNDHVYQRDIVQPVFKRESIQPIYQRNQNQPIYQRETVQPIYSKVVETKETKKSEFVEKREIKSIRTSYVRGNPTQIKMTDHNPFKESQSFNQSNVQSFKNFDSQNKKSEFKNQQFYEPRIRRISRSRSPVKRIIGERQLISRVIKLNCFSAIYLQGIRIWQFSMIDLKTTLTFVLEQF